jgi:hypothetical protein
MRSLFLHEFQQCLPHPLVPRKDKVYQKFFLGTMPKESFALEIDSNDDIDNFLTLTNIPQSQLIALRKEETYLKN